MVTPPGVYVGAGAGLAVATPPSPIIVSKVHFIVNAGIREVEVAVLTRWDSGKSVS